MRIFFSYLQNYYFIPGIGDRIVVDCKKRIRLGIGISSFGIIWFIFIGLILIPFYGGNNADIARHSDKFGISNLNIFSLNNLL